MPSTTPLADWFEEPAENWYEIEENPNPELQGVQAPKTGMPYDPLRFACMRGSGRVWACDGRYVAYRPYNHVLDKEANPAFQERIERFTRAGHFKHIGTFDEVMVFQLDPESPWYAKTETKHTAGMSLWKDIAHAVKLACNRDWIDYTDLLEAMATAMLSGRDKAFAQQQWNDALNQIMIGVYQRQGPLPAEIRAGVEGVRKNRGAQYGPKIVLASDVTQTQNVQREK